MLKICGVAEACGRRRGQKSDAVFLRLASVVTAKTPPRRQGWLRPSAPAWLLRCPLPRVRRGKCHPSPIFSIGKQRNAGSGASRDGRWRETTKGSSTH